MIYRCRKCQHEVVRGCLPTATCGLYMMCLLALSTGCIAGVARGIRAVIGEPPAGADPAGSPWWVGVIAVFVGVVLALVGMKVINFALELIEWLAFSRRSCPECGARRWSWGFTRGFGQ